MHVFAEMVDAVLHAETTGEWGAWARRWRDPVQVLATRALGREIYSISDDGRHRAMMAAAFGFPQLPARVRREPALLVGATINIRQRGFDGNHAEALVAAGDIAGENTEYGWGGEILVNHDIDWWFDAPTSVALIAAVFERVHPDVPLPPEMFHPDDWMGRFDPDRFSGAGDSRPAPALLHRLLRRIR
ncbi:hypothetical protein LSHI6S_00697 [Leifsonia shinshuensis]